MMATREAVGAVVTQGSNFIIVYKQNINTKSGRETTHGMWDFVKGGVERGDVDLESAIRRELLEETGSSKYRLKKSFHEPITFEFPQAIQKKIGYDNQVTTMFHFEYYGKMSDLKPNDLEINEIRIVHQHELVDVLAHQESKDFVLKNLSDLF